ncbi:MAG TPA: hypothetical protein VF084_02400 [Nitrososphaeraceae archaeon]
MSFSNSTFSGEGDVNFSGSRFYINLLDAKHWKNHKKILEKGVKQNSFRL